MALRERGWGVALGRLVDPFYPKLEVSIKWNIIGHKSQLNRRWLMLGSRRIIGELSAQVIGRWPRCRKVNYVWDEVTLNPFPPDFILGIVRVNRLVENSLPLQTVAFFPKRLHFCSSESSRLEINNLFTLQVLKAKWGNEFKISSFKNSN